MIESILPAAVAAVETRHDPPGLELFPEEERALANAVEKRRREFTTARACAREALGRLGFAPGPIANGARGEPCWPAGVVGSITHCEGYRACAVARSEEIVTIGIDAEPNDPLPDGLLADIARPEEQLVLGRLRACSRAVHWDRLLFSAKESVYKAWFPLAERWLGFEDAVLTIEPHARTFCARLLVSGLLTEDGVLQSLCGRWVVCDGVIATSVVVDRAGTGSGMLAGR